MTETSAPGQPPGPPDDTPSSSTRGLDGAVRSAISQAMTRIHAERFGKGATQAKTYAFDNLVVCVLRDVFTTVERTLIAVDKEQTVRDVRATFQYTLTDTFVDAVEELTGRKVASFMSQVDPANDIAVEIFVLEPASG